ncbi:hypothetical protein GTY86_06795, partial [Streptomyces sp. SID5770]|nr:hypothetical protein [Streptomyces sp. SID5770]
MTSCSGSSVSSGAGGGAALVADGAVVGEAEVVTEGGAAGPVDAPGLAVVPEAEAEGLAVVDGDAEGDADVRRGVGDDDVGSGLPEEEGDGSSETDRFRDALVVTSGTAARSSVPLPPPRAAAARAAVPATATAAT